MIPLCMLEGRGWTNMILIFMWTVVKNFRGFVLCLISIRQGTLALFVLIEWVSSSKLRTSTQSQIIHFCENILILTRDSIPLQSN